MGTRNRVQIALPSAGQVWPPPFNAAAADRLLALLPDGTDELNEVLLAQVLVPVSPAVSPVAAA